MPDIAICEAEMIVVAVSLHKLPKWENRTYSHSGSIVLTPIVGACYCGLDEGHCQVQIEDVLGK